MIFQGLTKNCTPLCLSILTVSTNRSDDWMAGLFSKRSLAGRDVRVDSVEQFAECQKFHTASFVSCEVFFDEFFIEGMAM